MPANDVVANGSYSVNTYKVYCYVGDELVHTDEVAYGESIPAYEYTPTNGDKFMGWDGEQYDTMPAHEVTYIANIESGILYINGDMSEYQIYDLNGANDRFRLIPPFIQAREKGNVCQQCRTFSLSCTNGYKHIAYAIILNEILKII